MYEQRKRRRFFTDEFVSGIRVVGTSIYAVLWFAVWMLGVWLNDRHTSSKAVHVLGSVIAVGGAIMCLLFAWLAIRAWILQNRR